MGAEQGERRAAVIETFAAETGRLPADDHAAVALFAAQRKARLLVIGIRRGFVIFQMARAALQRHVDELSRARLRVAIIAAHVLMLTLQRKARFLMHERNFGNILPALQRMATAAIFPERAVVRVFVASAALFRNAGEFERSMTLLASNACMLSFQREAGLLMPEFQILAQRGPAFGRMAIAARHFNIAVRVIDRRDLRKRGFRPNKK